MLNNMEHTQLLENAFTNYLLGIQTGNPAASPWPPLFNIFPGENNLDKNGQRIVCYVEGGQLGDEEPPNSGNRHFTISCELRTPIRKLTVQEVTDGLVDPYTIHSAVADTLQTAILNVNLPTLLEAAQANLTIFGLTNRTEFREQVHNAWISGWRVSGLSCPSYL
jgi:hypothetical protein